MNDEDTNLQPASGGCFFQKLFPCCASASRESFELYCPECREIVVRKRMEVNANN